MERSSGDERRFSGTSGCIPAGVSRSGRELYPARGGYHPPQSHPSPPGGRHAPSAPSILCRAGCPFRGQRAGAGHHHPRRVPGVPAPGARLRPAGGIHHLRDDHRGAGGHHARHAGVPQRDRATLEGTYFFPIPDDASISEFAIWDGDRRLVGEVRPRDEARRIYDDIVRRRCATPACWNTPAANLFQASIFPIPRARHQEAGAHLHAGAAGGERHGGIPVPAGHGPQRRARRSAFAGRVELRCERGLRTIYSPSHEVDVHARGRAGARASPSSRTPRRERRDFQLFYTPRPRGRGHDAVHHREPGKDGYFLLLHLAATTTRRGASTRPRTWCSCSTPRARWTGGEDGARRARALIYGVRGLQPGDRFNVIAFSGETRLMETGLIAADAAGRRRGEEFVAGLRARGRHQHQRCARGGHGAVPAARGRGRGCSSS